MEAEAYLLNLSLVAIGFASVSALAMLLRQMTGGPLTRFDIYLIVTFITGSFAAAVGALLPPMLSYTGVAPSVLWGISGVLAALLVASHLGAMIQRRLSITGRSVPAMLIVDWALFGLAAVLLLVDAWVGSPGLYAIGLTLVLGTIMFAFVRRLSSLLGGSTEGFDPRKG